MLKKILLSAVMAVSTLLVMAEAKGTKFAEAELTNFIKTGELPGAISIFYNNGKEEIATLGWANVEKKIPISTEQYFMQCSQTKGFCGVTIAILVEEGLINLDDPVAKYLPEFKELTVEFKDKNGKLQRRKAKNTLTIRMVMNHTGGFPFEIPSKREDGWPSLSLRDTAREAAVNPICFEPGTKMLYSNTGIDIGAAIVEVVTGKSWDDFLKERVLDPLGMKNTTFNPSDEALDNSISLYTNRPKRKAKFREFSKWMPLPHNGPGIHPSAGAGLWTTAEDQVKFYKMLMNQGTGDNGAQIVKKETFQRLLAVNTRPKGVPGSYSLGLQVSGDWCGHGGAWGTRAMVNWRTKQLRMLIVQTTGKGRRWEKPWIRAAEKFFSQKIDASGINAYTGRLD